MTDCPRSSDGKHRRDEKGTCFYCGDERDNHRICPAGTVDCDSTNVVCEHGLIDHCKYGPRFCAKCNERVDWAEITPLPRLRKR